jgi:LmbE family N-acetylglucosaminyl deacetylase
MPNPQRVLVLAPHTDDGEFGCGATIAKLAAAGSEVYYVAFSSASKSVPKGLPPNILVTEVKQATKVLGIKPDHLIIYDFEVRDLPAHRQEILEKLIQLKNELSPNLVFMPLPDDLHQDHRTIALEGLRAFKMTSVLGYELPWNNMTFNTQGFSILRDDHLKSKILALQCYASQSFRYYANPEFIRGLAITRGTQIGAKYAEAFEVLRWVMPI